MAHVMRTNDSLCGLRVIDAFLLSYPSPSLSCLMPPVKGYFDYTFCWLKSKGKNKAEFGLAMAWPSH